jgi:hypothetical protein
METIRNKYGSIRITADGKEETYRRPELATA